VHVVKRGLERNRVLSRWLGTKRVPFAPHEKQTAKRQLQTPKARSIRQLQAPNLPSPHATLKPQIHLAVVGNKTARLSIEEGMSTVSGHACYLSWSWKDLPPAYLLVS
jgi:hypothetical protein